MEGIKTIFEDKAILVLSKPHGFPTQSTEGESIETQYPDYHLITRLDQPAAGMLLLAKTEVAAMNLTKILNSGGLDKNYMCLVEGLVSQETGEVEHLLIKNGSKAYQNEKGKISNLKWKVHKRLDRYTFLDVEIKQGRFHQVRCQLALTGHPVKGDLKYGSKRSNKEGGIYLCCYQLSFEHPFTGEVLNLSVNPQDFGLSLWSLV